MARKEINWARQGARFENEVIAHLESLGYDCIRSAASKGTVDIVAVHDERYGIYVKDDEEYTSVLFVQCKRSKPVIPPAERTALLGLCLRAGALPIVAWRPDSTGPEYRILTGPGPKEWESFDPAASEV